MSIQPAFSKPFSEEGRQAVRPVEHFKNVTPEWAWEGSTGKGVKVAIIDSGIEEGHPAVGGPVSGYVCISEGDNGNLNFNYDPHIDIYGHGTACAGIIRAQAPDCELYSVRVLGRALAGRGSIFAAGLRWCIENGMQVCNLSLGTTKRDFFAPLHELADLAAFKNIMVVCAANNMSTPSFPSMYASVFSVASHTGKDPLTFYYNPEPPVEFGAPGIDVEVAWQNGQYINATGNSFAAPHISAIVTKILAKHPYLTVFQMKSILHSLAANNIS